MTTEQPPDTPDPLDLDLVGDEAEWVDEYSPAQWWTWEREELHRRVHELLDDGSGSIHPELTGLWLDLISMPKPLRGLNWIRNNPHVPQYLRGLARGDIPLTHEALHELESWRTAAHLRDLLMAAGALPAIDRQVLLFERWYRHRLTQIDDPGHVRLLRQFATWRLLPKLRAQAARRPLTAGSRNAAAGRFNTAAAFLTWLAGRGRQLDQTTQADVDHWHTHRRDPMRLRAFAKWP
jgi:hypothetical protein